MDPLHSTWDRILPFVTHAYNTVVQASTRISPFRALYGRDPRLPPEVAVPQPTTPLHSDAMSWWSHLKKLQPLLRKAITSNLHQAQLRQKRQHDAGRADHQYHAGDKVLVYFPIRRRGLSKSLMPSSEADTQHYIPAPSRLQQPLYLRSPVSHEALPSATTAHAHAHAHARAIPPPRTAVHALPRSDRTITFFYKGELWYYHGS